MALVLPRLDDHTWNDLVEEGRSLIPTFAPDWTNYNAADPGITLIELFAYFCEALIYRLDRIGEPNLRAFLRLINGPGWHPSGNLDADIRETLADLRRPHRAVSPADYERLALAANDHLAADAPQRVARAKCVPRLNPQSSVSTPGHIAVLIVPEPAGQPAPALLRRVRDSIEPARLLATRVHIVPPRYVNIGVRITLIAERQVARDALRSAALRALEKFLHPLEGGPEGHGWPFGRSVYASEIHQLLARLPGVWSVERTLDPDTGRTLDELTVDAADAGRLRFNRLRELEAVDLRAGELVSARLREDDITVTFAGRPPLSDAREVVQ
jgi:hypothetical protein